MQILSKLSDVCNKCSNIDNCDNKRMAACKLRELPKETLHRIVANNASSNVPLNSMPMKREHTPITIKMGEFGTINTSREEIAEQIKKNIYKSLSIECAFKGR